jgi:hypothetical protein
VWSRRASDLFTSMVLSTLLVTAAPPLRSSALADDPASAPAAPDENRRTEPGAPSTPDSMCQALAAAAAANDLPIEFFTRLIWQESRFKPDAVSRAGAQGVAQFMPGTARMRGLENPFDPLAAIEKSAQLLRDLRGEFGNLGLAAAAYNAGPGRVRDWLGGRRPLPGETRAYVRIVTGRSAEEWTAEKKDPVEMPAMAVVPCTEAALALGRAAAGTPPPKAEPPKPWGAEVVGAPTQAKALVRYRELQTKYAGILAGREPHFVIRGVIGDMGAVHVRVGAETRADASKLCTDLRGAGWYCEVFRN